jgi:N-acetylmuramoyl-L-alanine amidase
MFSVFLSASTQNDNVGVANYGTEASRMQELASRVEQYIKAGGGNIKIYRNIGIKTLEDTVNMSNDIDNLDIHVALHSNAGGGEGTEIYFSNYPVRSEDSFRLAKSIYEQVAPITIGKDRGIKPDTALYEMGLFETGMTKAIAVLLEIMFHDNAKDIADYLNKVDTIAYNIAIGIYKYFNIEYQNEVKLEEWQKILRKVSPYYKSWELFIEKHKSVNIKGLIVKIFNSRGSL